MRHIFAATWTALAATLVLAACSDQTTTQSNERIHRLDDLDRDGLLEEEGGGVIMPDPGDCPVMTYTEIHTVTVDESGMVISESWQVCTQCFEEDGTTPIGDEVCTDEPPYPIDVVCEEYDSGDPTVSCFVCYDSDGAVITDECYPLPIECATDADCPDGQVCYLFDSGGMDAPVPVSGGYCGFPDPCVAVPSLPDDPTGSDCWQCTDPMTGEDWGGWCNVHTCTTDADCADRGEACNEDTGLCEWVDPCVPVESLPSDPTGSDCWQCTDPVTGEDWGGWCNVHEGDGGDGGGGMPVPMGG